MRKGLVRFRFFEAATATADCLVVPFAPFFLLSWPWTAEEDAVLLGGIVSSPRETFELFAPLSQSRLSGYESLSRLSFVNTEGLHGE